MSFKGFNILALEAILCNRAETFLAIVVEGYPRNISVKVFKNRGICLEEDVIQSFFNF